MQVETQTEAILAPENAVMGESDESKSNRGGKRAGAGRKPNLAKRLLKGFSRGALAEAASTIDCGAVLVGLLKSKKEKTRMEALVFLLRIQLESKVEIKERGVDSPDDADAFALTFARRVVAVQRASYQAPPPRIGIWG